MRMLAPGEVPNHQLLSDLITGWGNLAYVTDVDYLAEVARRAAVTAGPVLECGSGLTTIVLGCLAAQRGVEVWSLEHLPRWHQRVNAALEKHHITGVQNLYAPLRDYGGFCWYDAPLEDLPDKFQLVVCDGPTGRTPGGRYGLWPVLKSRLTLETLVLLDDAGRRSERRSLQRWTTEANSALTVRRTQSGAYALVTFQ